MKTPYMRIRCNTDSGEKVFSFVLSAFWTSSGISSAAVTYYQMISEAITQAKKGTICVASPITDESINTPAQSLLSRTLKNHGAPKRMVFLEAKTFSSIHQEYLTATEEFSIVINTGSKKPAS